MANTSPAREKKLFKALEAVGGRDRRARFEQNFCTQNKWKADAFSATLGSLVSKGILIQKRGGRTLMLASYTDESLVDDSFASEKEIYQSERDLYSPIYQTLKEKWAVERGYDKFICEESHSKGGASTGGKFSRPDITLVGSKAYVHLPGRYFEVVTFEIKSGSEINVLGILEALSHREASHRSYAIYHASEETFEATENADRIESMAEKYGVGLILAGNPIDINTWSFRVEAKRVEPDPEKLDSFIGGLKEKANKDEILKWHR